MENGILYVLSEDLSRAFIRWTMLRQRQTTLHALRMTSKAPCWGTTSKFRRSKACNAGVTALTFDSVNNAQRK